MNAQEIVKNNATVLVVGGGGREHAIVHALKKSSHVSHIYAAPGNTGIAEMAECVDIDVEDVNTLLQFAQTHCVDMTIVGPEAALAAGIVDTFQAAGMAIFGPTRHAAQIESSKEFAKALMKKYHIPTADYVVFDDFDKADAYLQRHGVPIVLKYDGLAAGKGVVVAETMTEARQALHEMLLERKYGHANVIMEEKLEGQEFSFMCLVSQDRVYPLELAQDHKRAFDGDTGPNTGGMGAYSPLPFIIPSIRSYALKYIMKATVKAMKAEGFPFTGVLYGGLIKTSRGIKVIEFNARFGDPETEVVLPRLQTDFYELICKAVNNLPLRLSWDKRSAIGVVLASKGYPGKYEKNIPIHNLDMVEGTVYHMGTKRHGDQLVTNGGRVLFVTVLADTLREAQVKVNAEVQKIDCRELFHRTDIGCHAYEPVKRSKKTDHVVKTI